MVLCLGLRYVWKERSLLECPMTHTAFVLLCMSFAALGFAYCVYRVVRAALKQPKRMATYLPKPRRDSRDWQGDFHKSVRP